MELDHESIDQAFAQIGSVLGRKAEEVKLALDRFFTSTRKFVPNPPGPIKMITTEVIPHPLPRVPAFIGKSVVLKVDGWKPLEIGLTVENRINFQRDLVEMTIVAVRRMEDNENGRKWTRPKKPLALK